MCQNESDNRTASQTGTQNTPGREDLLRQQQPGFQEDQANVPGRHEDDEDLDGNSPSASGGRRDIQEQNKSPQERVDFGNASGEEMNSD